MWKIRVKYANKEKWRKTYRDLLWVEQLELASHDVERGVGQTAAQSIKEGHVEPRVDIVGIGAACHKQASSQLALYNTIPVVFFL